jgi:starch synthase
MRNKFNILYVASEVFPFTQVGPLGEVTGALPKYLKNYGHDIRVIMPNYGSINERRYVLREVIRLQGIQIKIGDDMFEASAKSAFIPDSKVQVYFLDNKHFFDRGGLYADSTSGKEYNDNAERFIFFCKGCLEILKLLHWQPHIIHCNDWQTAIMPLLLKTVYHEDPFFKNTKTLLSLHTPSSQGSFDSAVASKIGLPKSTQPEVSLNNGHFNFVRMGMEFADILNTSSVDLSKRGAPLLHYSDLSDVIKKRKDDLQYIGNGVDEQIWNPEVDGLIPAKYSRRDLSGKIKNKEEVVKRFGLRFNEKLPLVSAITRQSDDEAEEFLANAAEQLVQMDLQLLVAGPTAAKHKKRFKALQKSHPNKFGFEADFDTALFHLLIAGSDLSLQASRFDSGGVSQFYCLTYGTAPVVSKQGIGATYIVDATSDSSSGNGFLFEQFDAKELSKLMKNALKVYEKKEAWTKIMQNGMKLELSWDVAAQKYVKLYQKLLTAKGANK